MPYCSKCGTSNPDGETFCYKCGAKLINDHPHTETIDQTDSSPKTYSYQRLGETVVYNPEKQKKYRIPAIILIVLGVAISIIVVFGLDLSYALNTYSKEEVLSMSVFDLINEGCYSTILDFSNSFLMVLLLIYIFCMVASLIIPYVSLVSVITAIILMIGLSDIAFPTPIMDVLTVDVKLYCMSHMMGLMLALGPMICFSGAGCMQAYAMRYGPKNSFVDQIKHLWTDPF